MAEGIYITVAQTPGSSSSLFISDIDVGEGGSRHAGQGGTGRPGPVYIPTTGSVDIYFSSSVALSYEAGALRRFEDAGRITITFHVSRRVAAALAVYRGWGNYNDQATTVAPLVLAANTWTDIPNDAAGGQTDETYLPEGVSTLYNPATGKLVFDDLAVGSLVTARFDFNLTPAVNNVGVEFRLYFPAFGGFTLAKRLPRMDFGAGVAYQTMDQITFFIGSDPVRLNGATPQIRVTAPTSLETSGHFIYTA
jgi:hypothetical protein